MKLTSLKNADFIKSAQGLAAKFLKEGENADFSSEISDLNIKMGEKSRLKIRKSLKEKILVNTFTQITKLPYWYQ